MKGQSIGYIRVSSIDQNVSRQLEGLELDKTYIDKITGSTKDRPQLLACIDYAREGDTIYIHSIDRLARNLTHLQELVTQLNSKGVTVKFVKEQLTFSGEVNAMNKLLLQVMGAFAEFERTLIKERQREGIAQAKINGTKTGRPIGKQPLDPKLKPKAIELCDQGLNITEIAKSINISRASVYKLLQGHTRNIHY